MTLNYGKEMDEVGYCCVMIPEKKMWQGMFIVPAYEVQGKRALTAARALVGDDHDAVMGALCSALIHAYETRNELVAGVTMYALMVASKQSHFMVRGTITPTGIITAFKHMEATNTVDARAEIEAFPEVRAMKGEIVKGMSGEVFGKELDDLFRKIAATSASSGVSNIKIGMLNAETGDITDLSGEGVPQEVLDAVASMARKKHDDCSNCKDDDCTARDKPRHPESHTLH